MIIKKNLKIIQYIPFIIIIIMYLILIDYAMMVSFWEEDSFVTDFMVLMFIAILQLITLLLLRKNNLKIKKYLKIFSIFNFTLYTMLLVYNSYSIIDYLYYAKILFIDYITYTSYIRIWQILIAIILEFIFLLNIVMLIKSSEVVKKIVKILIVMLLFPISLWIIEEGYYNFKPSGMIISDYNEKKEVEVFGNVYELNPRYEVNLVGDDGYYELNGISDAMYAVVYNPYYTDIKVTDETNLSNFLESTMNKSTIKIFEYNDDTKVELSKYVNENKLIYIYDFSNFELIDYSDKANYNVADLKPKDILITLSDSTMYLYVRKEDSIYKYTFEKNADKYVQIGNYEFVGDATNSFASSEDFFNVELLGQTYVIDYAL